MDYFNSLAMETENMKLFLTLTGMTIDKWKMKMIQMTQLFKTLALELHPDSGSE
jgi:hypothetical protein